MTGRAEGSLRTRPLGTTRGAAEPWRGPLPAARHYLEQVVGRQVAEARASLHTGRQPPCAVAVPGHHVGVVHGQPVAHLPAKMAEAELGVVTEELGQDGAGPAAKGVLQGLRQVPVVEGDDGLDAHLPQAAQQPAVVGQPGGVEGRRAVGQQPGPGQREAVVGHPQAPQPLGVAEEVVVAVAGHVAARRPRRGGPRRRGTAVGEGVPDGGAFAALPPAALRLVGGAARPPEEAVGEGVVEEELVLRVGQPGEAGPGARALPRRPEQRPHQQQHHHQRRRRGRRGGGHAPGGAPRRRLPPPGRPPPPFISLPPTPPPPAPVGTAINNYLGAAVCILPARLPRGELPPGAGTRG